MLRFNLSRSQKRRRIIAYRTIVKEREEEEKTDNILPFQPGQPYLKPTKNPSEHYQDSLGSRLKQNIGRMWDNNILREYYHRALDALRELRR